MFELCFDITGTREAVFVEHLVPDERAYNLLCVSYQPYRINSTRQIISNRVSSDESRSVFAIAGGAGLDSFENLDSKLTDGFVLVGRKLKPSADYQQIF